MTIKVFQVGNGKSIYYRAEAWNGEDWFTQELSFKSPEDAKVKLLTSLNSKEILIETFDTPHE